MNLEDIERLKEFEGRLEQRLDRGDRSRLRRWRRLLLWLRTVAVAAGFVLLLAVMVVALAALLLP